MLLVGPWLGAETQLDGVIGEGGVEVTIAPIAADDLMYGLRLGGGYEYRSAGRAPALSATVLIGFRNAPLYSCDILTLAHGVRLFATARDTHGPRGLSMLVGVEIEPSLLFPPYSRRAFVGWGGNAECAIGL